MTKRDLYRDLTWLPAAPADFRARCRAAALGTTAPGQVLASLARYGHDVNGLSHLAKAVKRLRAQEADLAPLLPFRLGLLGNATTDFLLPALVASGLRHGLAIEVQSADYGQVLQSALDSGSPIHGCDAVVLAIDVRGLPLSLDAAGDHAAADAMVDAALAYVEAVRFGIHANGSATCLVQTVARLPETLLGNADRAVAGTWLHLAQQFNSRLAEALSGEQARGDVLVDVAAMAETIGLASWHDPTQWNVAKLPFALEYVPWYADQVCRVLAAVRGKSRKVLALDLDNTLWSGVIGDDGLEGIIVGQGNATGEAHADLQSYALALRSRGIVLAVSSKNDDAVARLPFQQHPDMLLREEHIAVFQANWADKATNLSGIAAELSLGIDALAFVDDNPFERNFVRESVPEVAVPELPEDAALYTRTLAAAGYFEALSLSAEDRRRAGFYQDNARRATLQKQVGNLDEYLASLEMEIVFGRFDSVTRGRVTQLINKSNQFNLTTRRYTEAEVAAVEEDPTARGMYVRLKDKFGDNGIISVLICRRSDADWEIDTWLMSCRVLGRRVEQAVLRQLLQAAREGGAERLIGCYRPTDRNDMVRDHYGKLGFTLMREGTDGETVWEIPSSAEISVIIPMVVYAEGEGTPA